MNIIERYPNCFEKIDNEVYVEYVDPENNKYNYTVSGNMYEGDLLKKYKFVLNVLFAGTFTGVFYSNNPNKLRTIAKDFVDLCWEKEKDNVDSHYNYPKELNYLLMHVGDDKEWLMYCSPTSDEHSDIEACYKEGMFSEEVYRMYETYKKFLNERGMDVF